MVKGENLDWKLIIKAEKNGFGLGLPTTHDFKDTQEVYEYGEGQDDKLDRQK